MAEFQRAKIDELIRKSAGSVRVSEEAKAAMSFLLESLAFEVSRQAAGYALAEKRKSVTAGDIRRARKEIWD
jgi:histone H3/H4